MASYICLKDFFIKTPDKNYVAAGIEDLVDIAIRLRTKNPKIRIYTLSGDLGAGKTTFVKAFCKALDIDDEVTSPTFSIVHEYGEENKVYHFDLYRLEKVDELYEIGFEEYLDSGNYVLIEWPELAKPFIQESYTTLRFEMADKNRRHIFYEIINSSNLEI